MAPSKKSSNPSVMQNHGRKSFNFGRIVFSPVNQGLRLPTDFMEKHGNSLHADTELTLTVPSGDSWSVRLRRTRTGLWLDRGWIEFAEYYGIQARHFLMFKYFGNAQFTVIIMGPDGLEIEYPIEDSDENLDRIDATNQEDFDVRPLNIEGPVSRQDKVKFKSYRKAKEFQSDNPFILSFMQRSYVMNLYVLSMNLVTVRDILPEDRNNCTVKVGVPGRDEVWTMNLNVYRDGVKTTVTKGWKEFALDNQIRVADTCVFELVDQAARLFEVTIFRNRH